MDCYKLKVRFVVLSNKQLFDLGYLIANDELYISPHVKLSCEKAAMINSFGVAENFRIKCLPIFRKRYGKDVEVEIVKHISDCSVKEIARVKSDTSIVSLRIEQDNFTPNKCVYSA